MKNAHRTIVIATLLLLVIVPASCSESGERTTAYIMALLTGYAAYTQNPYAIAATTAGTTYAIDRLNNSINERHLREAYAPRQRTNCCPSCGYGYQGGNDYQPQQNVYYSNSPGYENVSYGGLEPSSAYRNNRSNYTVGYNSSGPTFRYNASNNNGIRYSRPRRQPNHYNRQPQKQVVVVYYIVQ